MFRLLAPWGALALALAAAQPAGADVLQMPQEPPAGPESESTVVTVEMPARGMTMDKVEELFGAPIEKVPPVGEPPISRWIYKDFVVYFEHKWVIDSVVTRAPVTP